MTVYECQCGRRYSFLAVQLLCELSCSTLTERGKGPADLGGTDTRGPDPSLFAPRSVSVGKFGGRRDEPGQNTGRGDPTWSARPPFLPTGRAVNA
jgi:hypothetical protein